MHPIRTMIVEDEGLYRELLAVALQSAPEIEIVASVGDPDAAIAAVQECRPDVILMDIELGNGKNGVQLGEEIRSEWPRTGIVLLSNHNSRQYLSAGAPGWSYLLKRSVTDLGTLVRVVQGTALGLVVLDPRINETLSPIRGSRLDGLTPRQLEVLRLVAEGYSNSAIAQRLYVTEKSVENHLTAVYQELGIWEDGAPIHPRVRGVLTYLDETQVQNR